ncbi:hypothetical protein [uncultured Methanobrevibacter sp.]|uniref:hypothetical protein n=1 Tax=uncultured Methanobrevibacter sp. TaxID=253161 RepID=UPI00260B0D91|nr:hypothetical protein [uncultured Methanobrevibacter sp.]
MVVSIIIVLLAFGGIINEFILNVKEYSDLYRSERFNSRKPIKSKELEELVRNISFSNNVSQMKENVEKSNLFDFQKNILTRIANNHDIGLDARKALASDLISKFRKQWYESDLITVETLAEAELETINNWK